jgi:hypothetical protein
MDIYACYDAWLPFRGVVEAQERVLLEVAFMMPSFG